MNHKFRLYFVARGSEYRPGVPMPWKLFAGFHTRVAMERCENALMRNHGEAVKTLMVERCYVATADRLASAASDEAFALVIEPCEDGGILIRHADDKEEPR